MWKLASSWHHVMARRQSRCSVALALAVIMSGWPTVVMAQERTSLAGRVRDISTARPLADVSVTILDTGVNTRTNRWGEYRLSCELKDEVNIRLVLPGYATVVERVAVVGERTISDFELTPVDAVLDALVVTRPGPEAVDGEGGFEVRKIDLDEVLGPESGEVLKDVPGVLILQPSGQVGAGIKVQLRGLRSLFAGNEPLVYVDGVRTTSFSSPLPWIRGESALDFIPTSQIERIEVFKGPAATARFGTGALPGVIHIHTKKGPERRPQ